LPSRAFDCRKRSAASTVDDFEKRRIGVTSDHEILLRGNYTREDATAVRRHYWSGAVVAHWIERDAKVREALGDLPTHRGGMFANTTGKYESIEAAQHGNEGANAFFCLVNEELDRLIDRAVEQNARVRQGHDFREGITAFLEKRKPKWES